jgi:ketosteroid isomerase-like protein
VIEERMRAGYAAFNRGDYDEAVTYYHPDIELHRPGGLTPLVGVDALRGWMEPDAFAEQTIEPVSIEVGDGKVLVHQRMRAVATGSGIEMENDTWCVLSFDDDLLVTRIETWMFHEEATARAAAGLTAGD